MKRVFFISILLAFAFAGYSQQDTKAKDILEKVTKTTQGLSSLDAKFSFEMKNKTQNVQDKYDGSIVLKNKKYKLEIPQMGLQIISDGKTVWTYNSNSNEVNISNIDDSSDELMDPAKIFTIYQKGFDYKFVGEGTDGGTPVYTIDLTPQKPSGDIQKIKIAIDKQKMLIKSANMTGKDGNYYTVLVNQLKTDGVFPDSFFAFDAKKHKGVEIIDMR